MPCRIRYYHIVPEVVANNSSTTRHCHYTSDLYVKSSLSDRTIFTFKPWRDSICPIVLNGSEILFLGSMRGHEVGRCMSGSGVGDTVNIALAKPSWDSSSNQHEFPFRGSTCLLEGIFEILGVLFSQGCSAGIGRSISLVLPTSLLKCFPLAYEVPWYIPGPYVDHWCQRMPSAFHGGPWSCGQFPFKLYACLGRLQDNDPRAHGRLPVVHLFLEACRWPFAR